MNVVLKLFLLVRVNGEGREIRQDLCKQFSGRFILNHKNTSCRKQNEVARTYEKCV